MKKVYRMLRRPSWSFDKSLPNEKPTPQIPSSWSWKLALMTIVMTLCYSTGVCQQQIWPPSSKNIHIYGLLHLSLALLVYRQFFLLTESPECKDARVRKARKIRLQMKAFLAWDESSTPPSAIDLFTCLYNEAEERLVTEFVGHIPMYDDMLELFKKRLHSELCQAFKLTQMARSTGNATDVTINVHDDDFETKDDQDETKIHEFQDGEKLATIIKLYEDHACKIWGAFLDSEIVDHAKAYAATLRAEQRNWKVIYSMVKGLLPRYVFGLFLVFIDAWVGPTLWAGCNTFLDGLTDGSATLEEFKDKIIGTLITLSFSTSFAMVGRAFTNKISSQFCLRMRNAVMQSMVRQDIEFFDFQASGVLQQRLNKDTEDLSQKFFQLPQKVLYHICRILSNSVVIYFLKPSLLFLVLAPMPIVSSVQYRLVKYMKAARERQRKIKEQNAAATSEMIKEIRTVREFCMEQEEYRAFAANSSYIANIYEYSQAVNLVIFTTPLIVLFIVTRLCALYQGGLLMELGELTIGEAVQVSYASLMMTDSLRWIFDLVPDFIKMLEPAGRVCELIQARPKIEPHPAVPQRQLRPPCLRGCLEFKDVDFTFPLEPQKQILHSLSFRAEPGMTLAFVGSTGCGKSTAIQLIERFYNPCHGSILLDGLPIQDYSIDWLRKQISVVAQTNVLFSTTIRANILYGLTPEEQQALPEAAVKEACRKANAWDFIQEFPRGLETYVGEKGVKLSGGQRQRLSIARAIIRKPRILLLDEATSALDAKAEKVVQDALNHLIAERASGCTIMVAHRLTTIRDCDQIVVMDKGRRVEQGTHDELMAIPIQTHSVLQPDGSTTVTTVSGWYHELWNTQMKGVDA